jgi:hypothetical protein
VKNLSHSEKLSAVVRLCCRFLTTKGVLWRFLTAQGRKGRFLPEHREKAA